MSKVYSTQKAENDRRIGLQLNTNVMSQLIQKVGQLGEEKKWFLYYISNIQELCELEILQGHPSCAEFELFYFVN